MTLRDNNDPKAWERFNGWCGMNNQWQAQTYYHPDHGDAFSVRVIGSRIWLCVDEDGIKWKHVAIFSDAECAQNFVDVFNTLLGTKPEEVN